MTRSSGALEDGVLKCFDVGAAVGSGGVRVFGPPGGVGG